MRLLKVHLPYHESDHVLNLAYNVLCGGTRLEDIERLRHDTAYLNALGADLIPDPTTAGDFCRRFAETDVVAVTEAVNAVRGMSCLVSGVHGESTTTVVIRGGQARPIRPATRAPPPAPSRRGRASTTASPRAPAAGPGSASRR
ncbi:MAG TPA: hypothetical protein VMU34_14715 [Mycobacterium sp.]|nr:hypothetical protein [Mycobacterium sp.]